MIGFRICTATHNEITTIFKSIQSKSTTHANKNVSFLFVNIIIILLMWFIIFLSFCF